MFDGEVERKKALEIGFEFAPRDHLFCMVNIGLDLISGHPDRRASVRIPLILISLGLKLRE